MQKPNFVFQQNLDAFLEELNNPSSLWYDLKVAEMSGCDYIFAPDAICRQIGGHMQLEAFIARLQTLLGTTTTPTTLIAYWHDRYRQIHFERYMITWAHEVVVSVKKDLLDDDPQKDFISMLFEHSEALIPPASAVKA